MPQHFEGLRSFSSLDDALTALFKAEERVKQLETFRSNVAQIIGSWSADGRGDESTCHAVAFCVREVGP